MRIHSSLLTHARDLRDLIDRALRPGDGPLYVLTIGGPVNVSSAIVMEPAIKEKIVVVWLGGTPQYWPSAREFNLRQDVIGLQRSVPSPRRPFMTPGSLGRLAYGESGRSGTRARRYALPSAMRCQTYG